ncbi:hypothetical protein L211DRAFT_854004 [Terfezia boudieri ATCC MYA-4762]|uniref:Calcium channel YVC1-like C-terminal transmembrane domain-containing protein n=1 Tax=Terfezia boudieri ATCC MYA-4762 TaxID=1051890 RepID=A0A3N4L6N6_9PEZI|nr:hypothetical protein L211DRAFT_854004 [Terfezia boudieri ATCC MYA-4762]
MSTTYRSTNRPPSTLTEPSSPSFAPILDLPGDNETFSGLASREKPSVIEHIEAPYTLHQIQLLPAVARLANALSQKHNPSTVAALLWCRIDFVSHTAEEDRHGLSNARALACEVVAIDCVSFFSENDIVQYLGFEVPGKIEGSSHSETSESTTLLNHSNSNNLHSELEDGEFENADAGAEIAAAYSGLNALEIAIVAEAKYFLSQKSVQRVVDGIWEGRIVFWESLNVTGRKKPHLYDSKRKADPYSRLRVPKYQKAVETCFLAMLVMLYYAVLIERNPYRITGTETALLLFFVAFTVDEFTQWADAGTLIYASDIWSWLDMFVIVIGLAFLISRIIGLVKDNDEVVDMSFDILSLEALVLIPRTFSLLTLHPYFGRDKFSTLQMAMLMTRAAKSFATNCRANHLGETSHGFLIFIILTNILLITSLISLLSNNLTTMMNNARYSTFIMGSVTSNRLTYFYPPLNLIPLIFLRPLRLFLTSTQLRRMRIALLKFTHFPLVRTLHLSLRLHLANSQTYQVAAIVAYEGVATKNRTNRTGWEPSSSKQLATINRKNQQRLLARPPVAPIGGFARAASVSHGVSAADRETRRMREIVEELNLKLDALLAKQ